MAERPIPEELKASIRTAISTMGESTRAAYTGRWERFTEWCEEYGRNALPASAETVQAFIVWCAESGSAKLSTIESRLEAISYFHRKAGLHPPTDDAVVRVLIRRLRRNPALQRKIKLPLSAADVRRMADGASEPWARTLFLVWFCSALRRAEVMALEWQHIHWYKQGALIWLPKTKTGARWLAIPVLGGSHCAANALYAYWKTQGQKSGAVWPHSDRTAVRRLKAYIAQQEGLAEADFSGHSFRRGHVTQARRNGCPDWVIRRQTGHRGTLPDEKKERMLDIYTATARPTDLFEPNSCRYLGL